MLFVRALESIVLLPRAMFACFAIYHIYVFSCPMGFHMLALSTMLLFVTYLCLFSLRKFEKPAYYRGAISSEQPRAFFNLTSWPTWNFGLAPDFTVFMPVQLRARSAYETAPTPAPPTVPAPAPAAGLPAPERGVEMGAVSGASAARTPDSGAAGPSSALELPAVSIGDRFRQFLSGVTTPHGTGAGAGSYRRIEEGRD